jgi:hypothetical protein
MGVLVNIGRAQSQISLYTAYVAAVVFAIIMPIVVWTRWATETKPKQQQQPVWRPVVMTGIFLAVAAIVVVGARWWNTKVQSSKGWATFQGASTVSGMASGLFKD